MEEKRETAEAVEEVLTTVFEIIGTWGNVFLKCVVFCLVFRWLCL